MIGDLTGATLSNYQPSQAICDFTEVVKKDYNIGVEILNKPYIEFNDRSVIEDENRGQLMFNAFVDESVEDPNEAWRWRGTRSMARNKGIAMHANLTANFLLPLFIAQNDDDEVDRGFSEVMQDVIEWMAQPQNSNYQSSFMQMVFAMESNPVTFLEAEYCEVYQKIKDRREDGSIEIKEVLDEVLSGFQAPILSSHQVLITNAYQRNLQRQRSIIKRRYVDKGELEAKYGDHPNWEYVQTGIKSIYSEEDGLFYDSKDDSEHEHLVAEETYLNRREDTEVCFVNGIYLGESAVEKNPIRHRDNKGNPKYNLVPFGFSRIGEHFFYYKSMMNAMGWDNNFYDAMSEVVMNGALLEVDMPIAVTGTDQIDSEVIFPKAVVSLDNPDAKVIPLLPRGNMAAGFAALRETEKSMSEASVNETLSGQLPEASQKAYSVANAQANAKKLIGGVAKSLAESVIKYGDLMKDIAINHITVPQVEELVGGKLKMKYKTFVLEGKMMAGKAMDKMVKFDSALIGMEMTPTEKKYKEMELLEQTGYPKKKRGMTLVNPELFAKFKYLCKVDVESMFNMTKEYMQPFLLAVRRELMNDPYINMLNLDRKVVYAHFQSEGDDLIVEEPQVPQQPGAVPENPMSPMVNQIQNKQASGVLSGMV